MTIELIVFFIAFNVINAIITFALPLSAQKQLKEILDAVNRDYSTSKMVIPLEFMLGFFVTAIVHRWTTLLTNIGFVDCLALTVAGYFRGKSEECRIARRNIVRYYCLAQVLVLRDISMRIRKRFPTIDTVVAAGFMLPNEKEKFDEIPNDIAKYWMPFQWAISIVYKARQKNYVESDFYCERICQELRQYRNGLAQLLLFDWVPLPLAYPQLIYLAVHVHFLMKLILTQEIPDGTEESSLFHGKHGWFPKWIPILTLIQFVFYMGWFKVAMVLINPFGEDDDDFETNNILDRNLKQGIRIVDEAFDDPPDQKRDIFWGEEVDPLYSEEAANNDKLVGNELVGSVANIGVPENVTRILMMPANRPSIDTSPGRKQSKRVSVVEVDSKDRAPSLYRRRRQSSNRSAAESLAEQGLRSPSKYRKNSSGFGRQRSTRSENAANEQSDGNSHVNPAFTGSDQTTWTVHL